MIEQISSTIEATFMNLIRIYKEADFSKLILSHLKINCRHRAETNNNWAKFMFSWVKIRVKVEQHPIFVRKYQAMIKLKSIHSLRACPWGAGTRSSDWQGCDVQKFKRDPFLGKKFVVKMLILRKKYPFLGNIWGSQCQTLFWKVVFSSKYFDFDQKW